MSQQREWESKAKKFQAKSAAEVKLQRKAEHTEFDGSNGSSTEEREWWRVLGKDHVRNIMQGQIKTGFVYIAKDFVIYVDGDGETVNGFEQKTDSL